jgi:hypothetical protein
MATALQIAGALSVTIGLGLVWLPLAFIVSGIFAIVFGLAIERQK